jgi:lipopolysaccharide transport system permease protein
MRFFKTIITKRYLILKYLNRRVTRRYRGSILGVFWSLISPLAMLSVYIIVFGFIFKSRFNISQNETAADFGLALFCALNLYNLCAEVFLSSPKLILDHPNLVKKIVFPLETLPVVQTLDSLLHCAIAFVVRSFVRGIYCIPRHDSVVVYFSPIVPCPTRTFFGWM